ncbi:hypothetical protein PVK06_028616 [Gossypium arboreum]|uniref:Uncharacterized protein n=1 Tax=Gossypium arboreum TaxID=29729 RepID=A0ABR0P3P9_GOSAR|nr:hypothetical protein PVK06_028616 [Gossypium arboreum]
MVAVTVSFRKGKVLHFEKKFEIEEEKDLSNNLNINKEKYINCEALSNSLGIMRHYLLHQQPIRSKHWITSVIHWRQINVKLDEGNDLHWSENDAKYDWNQRNGLNGDEVCDKSGGGKSIQMKKVVEHANDEELDLLKNAWLEQLMVYSDVFKLRENIKMVGLLSVNVRRILGNLLLISFLDDRLRERVRNIYSGPTFMNVLSISFHC